MAVFRYLKAAWRSDGRVIGGRGFGLFDQAGGPCRIAVDALPQPLEGLDCKRLRRVIPRGTKYARGQALERLVNRGQQPFPVAHGTILRSPPKPANWGKTNVLARKCPNLTIGYS